VKDEKQFMKQSGELERPSDLVGGRTGAGVVAGNNLHPASNLTDRHSQS
jgi:hypothetical protein